MEDSRLWRLELLAKSGGGGSRT